MRSRGTAAALSAVSLVLAGLLAACSDEPNSATAKPGANPAPVENEPALAAEVMSDEPQRPADQKSAKGAEAFAGYVAEVVWYSAQQEDVTLLSSLDKGSSCTSCTALGEKLAEADSERQLLTKDITVLGAELLARSDNWIVGVSIDRPAIETYDDAGGTVGTEPAAMPYMELGISWEGDRWKLFDYRYAEE